MDSCGTNGWSPWGPEGCLLCPLDCIVLDCLTVRPLFCWCTGLEPLCSVQRYMRGVTLPAQVAEEMLWAKPSFHLAHHEPLPSSLSDSQRWEGQPQSAQEAPPCLTPASRRVLSGGLATLEKLEKRRVRPWGPRILREQGRVLYCWLGYCPSSQQTRGPAQLQLPGTPSSAPCWWSRHKLDSNLLLSSKR